MGNRIPPKGTEEYRRYWRDKRIIDEIKRVEDEVAYTAANTEPNRRPDFERSLKLIREARMTYEQGWKLPYIIEEVKL